MDSIRLGLSTNICVVFGKIKSKGMVLKNVRNCYLFIYLFIYFYVKLQCLMGPESRVKYRNYWICSKKSVFWNS